ncbi:polysaccharide deacetylase family protein [Lederbergia sp. NSJ-179]|uniref:polysaccharide deacetylase family protein n=1 Tax=Lederbergia sp. NSJ-179 TaxID=2931402 RepID=UPI001FD3C52B|nr:polysaccharide deacetylase family protein [Lederbergia sp. NSJ-179]MCJ7842414.1 polysaccharide deacetylase family protein [Lederbergia sp. NSJ-179]
MLFGRLLKACLISMLCVGLFTPFVFVQASTYPLQTKYPDIMIYKANTKQKVIALTFDDGPDRRFTPQVLDVLNKHRVKATFFLLGTRVHEYPDVAKRIHNEGHVLGNHTYWHPQLTNSSVNNMLWEIEKNEKEIKSATNFETKLFRAPYGALNDNLVKELGELGYLGVGWSIDTEDWKSLSSKEIKQNILNNVHPGAIILMHSAGHWTQDLSGTAKALDEIIPYLKKQGYEFLTIPEIFKYNMHAPEEMK